MIWSAVTKCRRLGLRRPWTHERIARLGFLVGLGWGAERISCDPLIASTPNNVYRRAQSLGLSFRAARVMSLELPPEAHLRFGGAASRRGLTPEALARRLLHEIASDPNLVENILDDAEVAA
jgi:hypothetical protein